jgi:hypothetical protein
MILLDSTSTITECTSSNQGQRASTVNPYRFWVLTRLKELYRIYRDESLIEKYVLAHPYDFSYRTFFELRKQEKQAS